MMKNIVGNFFDHLSKFFPAYFIAACLLGYVWLAFGYLYPRSVHTSWQHRVDFCKAAEGYHTNETFGDLTVCRSLHDHSVFYVDTSTGARYNITPISSAHHN